jgi:hypothetical protein
MRTPFREWWQNHKFPQQDLNHANLALVQDFTTLTKALELADVDKRECHGHIIYIVD